MYRSWDYKYAPKNLENYIFQSKDFEETVKGFVESGSFPNMALYGHRGTGKSTLVRLLRQELEIEDVDFLTVEGGQKGNIEEIRSRVMDHIKTLPVGDYKVVFIEEADLLSTVAMNSLKNIINPVEFPDTRFILAYNHEKKITNEVKSRLTEFHFNKIDKDAITRHACNILKKEGASLDDELIDNVLKYVNITYPDIRKLLLTLQRNFVDGKLKSPEDSMDEDSLTYLATMFESLETNSWHSYKDIFASVNDEEYIILLKSLLENICELESVKTDSNEYKMIYIIINDYINKANSGYADGFINFSACMCRLQMLLASAKNA